jgi:hypothetical protein
MKRRGYLSNYGFPRLLSLVLKAQSFFGSLKLNFDFLIRVNCKAGGKYWVLDSGCSQHMTDNDSMFTTLGHPGECEHVTYGDNSRARIVGLGRIVITKDLSISNILFIEYLSFNLLSVAQLYDLGLICTFDKNDVVVIHEKDKSLVFKGFRHRHIYLVDFSSKEANSMACLFSK